jgi:hypothetical protein
MGFSWARQFGFILLAGSLSARLAPAESALGQNDNVPELAAGELVRQTVAHELEAANATSHRHMFRSRKQLPRGSQTRLYVETNDSIVGMTIATNDQPLNAQQQKAEQDRLAWLAGNPEQLRKKKMREKEDEDRTLRILRALPNAFRYQYGGTEAGQPSMGKIGNPLTRLKFTPNPSYSPPSRLEQVLQGMQGYLLIDAETKRLARIDGTLFRDVSFGWGIIGHLDRGGHFSVQQADIGDDSWGLTAMNLNITGKILLFRGISIISDEVFSDFQRVPDDLSFAKGVELLKTEQEKLARGAGSFAEGNGDR